MCRLNIDEAKEAISKIGSAYFNIGEPVFPEGRKDVCAILRTTKLSDEDNILFLVWLSQTDEIRQEKLFTFRCPRDFPMIDQLEKEGDKFVVGLRCGTYYHEMISFPLSKMDVRK